MIFHVKTRPHVALSVKLLELEILLHLVYSSDIAPFDFHLFRLMQHALEDTHFQYFEERYVKIC